jgi:soluble lytic murein transglycosylase
MRAISRVLLATALLAGLAGAPAGAQVPVPELRPAGISGLTRSDAAWRSVLSFAGDGDWARAAQVRGREADPVLDAVLTWQRLRDGSQPASFTAIEQFLDRHPDWPDEDALIKRGEAAMDDDLSLARRFAWFAKFPPRTTVGRLKYLSALDERGGATPLVAAVRDTWRQIEFGKRQERQFIADYGQHLREIDHIERLDEMLWRGKAGAARRTFKYVPEGWRKLADARLRLRFRQSGVDAAIKRIPEALRDDPGLHYERLRWRRKAGMRTAARELLFETPPSDEFYRLWWRERAYHIREALDDRDYDDAYLLAASHIQRRGGPYAEAEWLAGWIALRFLDRPADALRHFGQMHGNVSTPISSSRAAYWAGRAAEVLDDPSQAEDWYTRGAAFQTTFYGQLAAARIGQTRITLPAPAAPHAAAIEVFEADARVAAVRALIRLGMDRTARLFLRHLAVESDDLDRSALIAALSGEAGLTGTAVFTARRAALGRRILPDLGYPLLDDLPPDGPEPALVHAIIRQESSFERTAISRVGARGLMQLMPATAKQTARGLGLAYDLGGLIGDPAYNVRLGSAYLDQMVTRFDGTYVKAIAAYNAGPGRIARWVDLHGDPNDPDVDVIDWIERIPFRETRNYVQRVLEALHVYRHWLAGDHDQAMVLALADAEPRKVWCVFSCGVLLDRQHAALESN